MTEDAVGIITVARKSRLWSIRRLSRESGLSVAYLSQIESGKRPLTRAALSKIAPALGMTPYLLMTEAGFIPREHLAKAQQMAKRASEECPEIVAAARGRTKREKQEWLVADYLLALGDDPYGKNDGEVLPPAADWTPLDPDAPETAAIRLRRELDQLEADATDDQLPSTLEGWDELSDTDKAFVQQMVNKLRRPPTGE